MRKFRVYVAGPMASDPEAGTYRAIDAAEEVFKLGAVPYVPHLNYFYQKRYPHEREFWLAYDNEFLAVCDGLLRLPGESAGSDAEVKLARKLGLPVFRSTQELADYLARRAL